MSSAENQETEIEYTRRENASGSGSTTPDVWSGAAENIISQLEQIRNDPESNLAQEVAEAIQQESVKKPRPEMNKTMMNDKKETHEHRPKEDCNGKITDYCKKK
jgi:hypothetical protein